MHFRRLFNFFHLFLFVWPTTWHFLISFYFWFSALGLCFLVQSETPATCVVNWRSTKDSFPHEMTFKEIVIFWQIALLSHTGGFSCEARSQNVMGIKNAFLLSIFEYHPFQTKHSPELTVLRLDNPSHVRYAESSPWPWVKSKVIWRGFGTFSYLSPLSFYLGYPYCHINR